MTKNAIHTQNAPAAVGPYSQAIATDALLITSGQIPLSPVTNTLVEGDIRVQTAQVLDNLKAVLAKDGLDFSNVLKTTVFLTDINDFSAMNDVYATYFTEPYPARSAVQVAALPKGAIVEIECICTR